MQFIFFAFQTSEYRERAVSPEPTKTPRQEAEDNSDEEGDETHRASLRAVRADIRRQQEEEAAKTARRLAEKAKKDQEKATRNADWVALSKLVWEQV